MIGPPAPVRLLDDKPLTARHIVKCLSQFKDEKDFADWGFRTITQAKHMGMPILWVEGLNYIRIEFQYGRSATY